MPKEKKLKPTSTINFYLFRLKKEVFEVIYYGFSFYTFLFKLNMFILKNSQDPRVLDTMLPYLTSYYGNPHSRTHSYGWETEKAVEKARKQVADLIGADPKEIIFTSGATESNNIAVKGVARFYKAKKKHVITTQTVRLF